MQASDSHVHHRLVTHMCTNSSQQSALTHTLPAGFGSMVAAAGAAAAGAGAAAVEDEAAACAGQCKAGSNPSVAWVCQAYHPHTQAVREIG